MFRRQRTLEIRTVGFMVGHRSAAWRICTAVVTLVVSGCSGGELRPIAGTVTTSEPTTTPTSTQAQQRPAGPPVDNTVTVKLFLADSFDIHPDGTCSGRSETAAMTNGARVQLRGDTVGGSVWSVATTRFDRVQPPISNGKPLGDDDGLYCDVEAVFRPIRPDPSSQYSIKFVGGDWLTGLIKVGRAPFGQEDRPGFGTARITLTACRSLGDPPDKDCPERGN